jgi:serine/threonine protein kinase
MDKSSDRPSGALVTEYQAGVLLDIGTLGNLLKLERRRKAPAKWNATQKAIVLYGSAVAMMILHRHKVMHRNFSPWTICVDENIEPKLSGFRCSKYLEGDLDDEDWGWSAPLYTAPEAHEGKVGLPGDVFAFGVTAYQVVTGFEPDPKTTRFQAISSVCRGERPSIPQTLDRRLYVLIERCWHQDPGQRPTAPDVVRSIEAAPSMFGAVDEAAFGAYRSRIAPWAEALPVDAKEPSLPPGEIHHFAGK